MKVDLSRVGPEGIRIEKEISAVDLDDAEARVSFPLPLRVRLEAKVVSGMGLFDGRISTEAEFVCSRCLKGFRSPVTVEEFRHARRVPKDGIIDLTEWIREDTILALPIKPICEESCRGLCPRCGTDLNTGTCCCAKETGDGRWGALDDLPTGG